MKLQYLGDSKDAFKWDYLDFLVKNLNMDSKEYKLLVVPMLTKSDSTGQGGTHPSEFLSVKGVQEFCLHLRDKQELKEIKKLPFYTNNDYKVCIHKEQFHEKGNWFVKFDDYRQKYFAGIGQDGKAVMFLDPDNGFETKRPENTNEQHVKYSDINNIYSTAKEDDIMVVFQHERRKSFSKDYQEIMEQLKCKIECYQTALSWGGKIMFIIIGKSEKRIDQVQQINHHYVCQRCSVKLIPNKN